MCEPIGAPVVVAPAVVDVVDIGITTVFDGPNFVCVCDIIGPGGI